MMNTALKNVRPRATPPARPTHRIGHIDPAFWTERGAWIRCGGSQGAWWYFLWADNPAIRRDVTSSVTFKLVHDDRGRPVAVDVAPIRGQNG
jgi:hypothetical protein